MSLVVSPSGHWPRDFFVSILHRSRVRLFLPVLLAGIVAFLTFLYWESVTVMYSLWQLSSHQHGLLVFPIFAYLIWRLLPQIGDVRLRSEPWGILLVTFLVLIWIASRLAGIQFIEHVSFIAMLPAAVVAIMGREFTHKILFPLSILLLAVPIGDSLVPYLMSITADISSALLWLSGVPFLRDGQRISLPGGDFVVAEVCSGVRYLMSGMTIALLFSYLTFQNYRKRGLFLLVAGVMLVLANGLRAYLVMTIASVTEMRLLVGDDHIYFGWALFGIFIFSLMWIGAKYADEPEGEKLRRPSGETTGDEGREGPLWAVSRNRRSTGVVAIVATLFVLGPQSVAVLKESVTSHAAVPSIALLGHCGIPESWANDWFPQMPDADIETAATLSCADGQISVYVAGYATALQGSELISGSNRLTPSNWGRYSDVSVVEFMARDGRLRRVKELDVGAPDFRELIWYWYDVDGHTATGGFVVKALQVWALLRGRPAGGYVVLLTTPIGLNKDDATRRLEAVSADLMNAELQITSSDQR